jgi:hypothetical protein
MRRGRHGLNGAAISLYIRGRDAHCLNAHRVTGGGRPPHVVTAFTEDGIENLRQIIVAERTAGRAASQPS